MPFLATLLRVIIIYLVENLKMGHSERAKQCVAGNEGTRVPNALVGKRSTKLMQKDRGGWRGGWGWFEDD